MRILVASNLLILKIKVQSWLDLFEIVQALKLETICLQHDEMISVGTLTDKLTRLLLKMHSHL